MKFKFKTQAYQTAAVESVVDCFEGQISASASTSFSHYHMDIGQQQSEQRDELTGFREAVESIESGFKNADITLSEQNVLKNIQGVQRRQNLPKSKSLIKTKVSPLNLDVEMETGTGKTYCYIKTIFEMNKRFGWSKFIIVVPSIAIREGVYKSLEMSAEHFQELYGKIARYFIYNSRQLHALESFSSNAEINIMIINVQAFNARGRDNRRIYEELDTFQSCRPIDVIKANRPILILDEPQKMEGTKTMDSMREFCPLFVLRYSATYRTRHNTVHRLDALDAYNQKLVKKIAVRGISVRGLPGTNAYVYLESIEVSKREPVARMEIEIRQRGGIKRAIRRIKRGDNLHNLSGGLDEYQGFVLADINAITNTVEFLNGHCLQAGEATGDVDELVLRRIQIREAIQAHLEKEQGLYHRGIKVLTLFFIDKVARYRVYTDGGASGGEQSRGEYARMFEEEYQHALDELKQNLRHNTFMPESSKRYEAYVNGISVEQTHNGYFSIDKKSRRMIDPVTGARSTEADDADAYDLILKDKERLLSFDEPVRFIFSHSALREGWDNPNVFVMCALKHSNSIISRRQEVGRGLRIAVNQYGERQDDPATVRQTNVLTVVASESYKDFVSALQKDMSESLSDHPRTANAEYFTGKIMRTAEGSVEVTRNMAEGIEFYLIQNNYVDREKHLTLNYHDACENGALADLPADLQPYKAQVTLLINSLYSDAALLPVEDERKEKRNSLNANFDKKEFKELWSRINRKAFYTVRFDSNELSRNCIQTLNAELRDLPLQYTVERGAQADIIDYDHIKSGSAFHVEELSAEYQSRSTHSRVKYDLVGRVAENTQLTRRTVFNILTGIERKVFDFFTTNPENFIAEASRLIQEQIATVIIERLSYNAITETYDIDIFTDAQVKLPFGRAGKKLDRHIYDYVLSDSRTEQRFAEELDKSREVAVYAKLPRGFSIPTPVGTYNPDWAIAFREGMVTRMYFVAETKGSLSSMHLRKIEQAKIACARKFFTEINRVIHPKEVTYRVAATFSDLMGMVGVKK